MDATEFYDYLTRARRQLWPALRALPDEKLSKAVVPIPGARCIKDLIYHIAAVEDGWFRVDLFNEVSVMERLDLEPTSEDSYWHHQDRPLEQLLSYWEAVEQDTLARWPALMAAAQSERRIQVNEDSPNTISVDEVIWHVMQHEVRHTAQIATMFRLAGEKPPSSDLAFLMAREDSRGKEAKQNDDAGELNHSQEVD